jgi:hypothetical protein
MAHLVEEGNVEGEAELILQPDLVRELIAQLASRRRRIGQQRLDIPKNNFFRLNDCYILTFSYNIVFFAKLKNNTHSIAFAHFCASPTKS